MCIELCVMVDGSSIFSTPNPTSSGELLKVRFYGIEWFSSLEVGLGVQTLVASRLVRSSRLVVQASSRFF